MSESIPLLTGGLPTPLPEAKATGAAGRTKLLSLKETPRVLKPFIAAARLIHAIGLEILHLYKLGPMSFSIQKMDPADPKELDSNSPPILFIHGFLGNSGHWLYHKKFLQGDGGKPEWSKNLFTVDLGAPYHSIEEYAFRVHERVVQIQQLTGKKEVVIAAHSMGGLVADAYKEMYAEQDGAVILDTITLGSPLSGTWIALLAALFSRCAQQMLPSSAFSRTRTMEHVEPLTEHDRNAGIIKKTIKCYTKDNERVWEEVCEYRGERKALSGKTFRERHTCRRTYKSSGEIQEESFYDHGTWIEPSPSRLKPRKWEKSPRTKHFGSEYDIVVPSESAQHVKARQEILGESDKPVELKTGGHLSQLTRPEAHWALRDRIQETVSMYQRAQNMEPMAPD